MMEENESKKIAIQEVAYENLSLIEKIYKRKDIYDSQMTHTVIRMIQSGYEKDKIINEVLDRYKYLEDRFKRLIELYPHPLIGKEKNYLETGKYE